MKIPLRRIGNSLGVILPKATLDAWGMGEGDVDRVDDGLDRQSIDTFEVRCLRRARAALLRLLDNRAVEKPQLCIYTKNIYVSRWLV
jgi:antitoxin component of MazEF toxin-antitoxin module